EERKLLKDQNDEIRILRDAAYRKLREIVRGKKLATTLQDEARQELLAKGSKLTDAALDSLPRRYWVDLIVDEDTTSKIMQILGDVEDQILEVRMHYGDKIEKLREGDDLNPGVIKMVKVYVAIKRKI